MTTTIQGIDGLKAKVGEHLGYSDYLEITQDRVNQWIHVDVDRANRESPFGGPIAHGYLTLALAPSLLPQVLRVEGVTMGVNYGANKVRFPSPVPVGSKLRAGAGITSVEDVGGGGAQVTLDVTFEVEGAPKPACVAQVVFRYYA
jgi:acyl dehydratase